MRIKARLIAIWERIKHSDPWSQLGNVFVEGALSNARVCSWLNRFKRGNIPFISLSKPRSKIDMKGLSMLYFWHIKGILLIHGFSELIRISLLAIYVANLFSICVSYIQYEKIKPLKGGVEVLEDKCNFLVFWKILPNIFVFSNKFSPISFRGPVYIFYQKLILQMLTWKQFCYRHWFKISRNIL